MKSAIKLMIPTIIDKERKQKLPILGMERNIIIDHTDTKNIIKAYYGNFMPINSTN